MRSGASFPQGAQEWQLQLLSSRQAKGAHQLLPRPAVHVGWQGGGCGAAAEFSGQAGPTSSRSAAGTGGSAPHALPCQHVIHSSSSQAKLVRMSIFTTGCGGGAFTIALLMICMAAAGSSGLAWRQCTAALCCIQSVMCGFVQPNCRRSGLLSALGRSVPAGVPGLLQGVSPDCRRSEQRDARSPASHCDG